MYVMEIPSAAGRGPANISLVNKYENRDRSASLHVAWFSSKETVKTSRSAGLETKNHMILNVARSLISFFERLLGQG